MPPYQFKQQLKRYISQYGEPDPLTRHLILIGDEVGEPLRALEPYVKDWERTVAWMQKNGIGLEEYDYDLFIRSSLDSVLMLANEQQLVSYESRIEKSDLIFCSLTLDENGSSTADRTVKEWWLKRIPR